MKRRHILGIIFLSLLVNINVHAESLVETINKSLSINPELLSLSAQRKIADNRLKQSFAGYLPKFNINVTYGKDKNKNDSIRAVTGGSRTLTKRELNYTMTQMIFDGFFVKNSVEENSARLKGSTDNVVSTVEDLILRITEVYLETIRRQQIVTYAKDNLSRHQEIYKQIELRSKSGIGSKVDVEQAKGRLAKARTNLMSSQANYRDAEANFIRVIGYEPIELVKPVFKNELLPASSGVAVSLAIENHPSLQAAIAEIKAAEAQKRAAKSSYFPTFEFEVGGTNNNNVNGVKSKTSSLSALVRMRYNIFNGGADRAREQETIWELERVKQNKNQVRRQVEQSTRLAWNTYVSTKSQLQYFKEHVDSSLNTRNAFHQQFTIGQRTLLDLLNTENELFDARSSYVSAQFNELLGKYRILNSMGKLSDYLQISLPETANYNPNFWVDSFQL